MARSSVSTLERLVALKDAVAAMEAVAWQAWTWRAAWAQLGSGQISRKGSQRGNDTRQSPWQYNIRPAGARLGLCQQDGISSETCRMLCQHRLHRAKVAARPCRQGHLHLSAARMRAPSCRRPVQSHQCRARPCAGTHSPRRVDENWAEASAGPAAMLRRRALADPFGGTVAA